MKNIKTNSNLIAVRIQDIEWAFSEDLQEIGMTGNERDALECSFFSLLNLAKKLNKNLNK